MTCIPDPAPVPLPRGHGKYVYMIQRQSDGAIKIGISRDPARRARGLTSACGSTVTLLATANDLRYGSKYREGRILAALQGIRLIGEWFMPKQGADLSVLRELVSPFQPVV